MGWCDSQQITPGPQTGAGWTTGQNYALVKIPAVNSYLSCPPDLFNQDLDHTESMCLFQSVCCVYHEVY